MKQKTAIRNTLTEARVLWKNNIEFWITQLDAPWWCGILIDERWKRANPHVTDVDKLYKLFKDQKCDGVLGKRPIFYVVK